MFLNKCSPRPGGINQETDFKLNRKKSGEDMRRPLPARDDEENSRML